MTRKEEQVTKLEQEMTRERTINKYHEEIELFYDAVSEEKLQALSEEIPELESEKEKLNESFEKTKEDYHKISSKFEDEKEDYETSYGTVLKYVEDIPAEKMAITKEKRQINTRKKELELYKKRILEEKTLWNS